MLLVVVLPLASISVVLASEVTDGAAYVRNTLRSEGVQGIVNDLPGPAALAGPEGAQPAPGPGEPAADDAGSRAGAPPPPSGGS